MFGSYSGYSGIMEKKVETTMYALGFRGLAAFFNKSNLKIDLVIVVVL